MSRRIRYCWYCGTDYDARGRTGRNRIYCPEHLTPEQRRNHYRIKAKQTVAFTHTTGGCTANCNLLYAIVEAAKTDPDWTLQAIGNEFEFTRERARQLIQEHGWKLDRAKRGRKCYRCNVSLYGKTYTEHAKEAGHDRETWYARAREERTNWEAMALGIAAYQAGYTALEMEEVLGFAAENVYRFLQRSGLRPNRNGFGHYDRNTNYFKRIHNRHAETLALLDSGSTIHQVAEMTSMTTGHIYSLSSQHKGRHNLYDVTGDTRPLNGETGDTHERHDSAALPDRSPE